MSAASMDEYKKEYAARRRKYREVLASESLDGLLVTHLPDVRYLCGFSGSNGLVLIMRNGGFFFTDFRYMEQSAQEVVGFKRVVYAAGVDDALAQSVESHKDMRLGFDPTTLSYSSVMAMRRRLKGKARIVPVKSSLMLLRAAKSRLEMESIRKGIRIAEKAFRETLRKASGNFSEIDLAASLDIAARGLGAEAPAFETIVASGSRGALAHARPSSRRLRGVTVIDWGVVWKGYHTDSTRTVAFGSVPQQLRKAHGLVLEAQERSLEMIKPGVKARDVDAAARQVIEEAGYGEAFGHGLGHGVGLEVHERPYVGRTSQDILEEGMVLTNEPGIYLPGIGGVRIEDMVLLTRDGAELLTSLPRSLELSDY